MTISHGVDSVAKVDGCDGDAIFAVVDAPTVREDVDVCAFGTKLAIALQKSSPQGGL